MPSFLPGAELSRAFYAEAVRPLLGDLPHTAARVGPGSDVLGFDSARSTDHDWGPRLELFLTPADLHRHGADLSATLSARLPKRFRDWSTHFEQAADGVWVMADTDGPVAHHVRITEIGAWCDGLLGFDPRVSVTLLDWLATPWQRFAEVTGGAVFHDGLGELHQVRARLRWYPPDVWRYALACQWQRISEEEPFVGRCAEAGDDTGSRLVAGRLARDVARLCLLLARRWPPYQKWLGVALARESAAAEVAEALGRALRAAGGEARQQALCDAYELAGAWQNRLGLAAEVPPVRRSFFGRPYPVIEAGRYAEALTAAIGDPAVAAMPGGGSIDQVVDNIAVLSSPGRCRATYQPTMNLG